MGQHLKRHILEGAGRPVPQLQAPGISIHRAHRGHVWVGELSIPIGRCGKGGQLRGGEVLQKALHHIYRPLLIGHVLQLLQRAVGQMEERLGGHEPSVRRQSPDDGLGGGHPQAFVSCADIVHN